MLFPIPTDVKRLFTPKPKTTPRYKPVGTDGRRQRRQRCVFCGKFLHRTTGRCKDVFYDKYMGGWTHE